MWRCEASHDHAASSEGWNPSAAGSMPETPGLHWGPLGGAGRSFGASVVSPSGLVAEHLESHPAEPADTRCSRPRPLRCSCGVLHGSVGLLGRLIVLGALCLQCEEPDR